MSRKLLKSNVTLFFNLFISRNITSNMYLPKKIKKLWKKRAVVQPLRALKYSTFILCRQSKPKGFKLTMALPVIQADYTINTVWQEGSIQITSAKNTGICSTITLAIWSVYLFSSCHHSAARGRSPDIPLELLKSPLHSAPPAAGANTRTTEAAGLYGLVLKHYRAQALLSGEAPFPSADAKC